MRRPRLNVINTRHCAVLPADAQPPIRRTRPLSGALYCRSARRPTSRYLSVNQTDISRSSSNDRWYRQAPDAGAFKANPAGRSAAAAAAVSSLGGPRDGERGTRAGVDADGRARGSARALSGAGRCRRPMSFDRNSR